MKQPHPRDHFAACNPYCAPRFWKKRSNAKPCGPIRGLASIWTTPSTMKHWLECFIVSYCIKTYHCTIWHWKYSTNFRMRRIHVDTQAVVPTFCWPVSFFESCVLQRLFWDMCLDSWHAVLISIIQTCTHSSVRYRTTFNPTHIHMGMWYNVPIITSHVFI